MYVHVHLYISHAVQMSDNHESGLIAQNRLINQITYYHDPSNPDIYNMHVHAYIVHRVRVDGSSITMVTKIERLTHLYTSYTCHMILNPVITTHSENECVSKSQYHISNETVQVNDKRPHTKQR